METILNSQLNFQKKNEKYHIQYQRLSCFIYFLNKFVDDDEYIKDGGYVKRNIDNVHPLLEIEN